MKVKFSRVGGSGGKKTVGLTAGGCRRRVHLTFPGRMNVGDQAKVGEPVGGLTLSLTGLVGRQNHRPYVTYPHVL